MGNLGREREGQKNVCQERDAGGERDTGVRAEPNLLI